MSDFILELYSEEIPAKMQKTATENFLKIAYEILSKNHLKFDRSQIFSYVTPNRLILKISNFSESQIVLATKKQGPKIDADISAINGFMKSVNIHSIDQLKKSNGYYIFEKSSQEINSIAIIRESLNLIINKMVNYWPKLMKWDVENYSTQPKWIRPIRNILAIFDNKIVELEFAGLKSSNTTFDRYGNNIIINNALDYENIMFKNFIIINHDQRKEKIISEINLIKNKHNLELYSDITKSGLIDEVVGLSEFPVVLIGNIEKKFLNLPKEALILTLENNQKYFCCKNHDDTIANKFIFVINSLIDDINLPRVINDNEKVVRARLSDLEFFINEDLKKPLESYIIKLQKIIFHQELGTVFDKCQRMKNLSKFVSIFVPHSDLSLIERVVELSKADLVTKAVAEIPELQGKIGSYYATKQKENDKVAIAIYEQYMPIGANQELPKTSLGMTIAITDKIDSIVGFFLINEKPTSSKDPYALRRAVIGIIKIIFNYNIAIPIKILIEKSLSNYPNKILKKFLQNDKNNFYINKKLLVEEILKFFIERLKIYLKEQENINSEIVNVIIDNYLSNTDLNKAVDILYLAKKIKFLNEFLINPKNKKIIELYKRSANILFIEEKKDQKKYMGKPSIFSLKEKHEKILYRRIKKISSPFRKLVLKGEFESALKMLDIIEIPLANFFDNVIVNEQDNNLRENRLLILSMIRSVFEDIGDLSKIELN